MGKIFNAFVVALCCTSAGTILLAHAAPQTAAGTTKVTKIGKFFLKNVGGSVDFRYDPVKGTNVTLSGSDLQITSSRYDIAAPKIVLLGKKATATNAKATGGVRIAVRNPEQSQDTLLTSDSAEYVGASEGKNPFIYAVGNVHAVTRTPDFEADSPLVTDSRKATIELLPNGGYNINFDGINATGTPVEKAPAPKRKP